MIGVTLDCSTFIIFGKVRISWTNVICIVAFKGSPCFLVHSSKSLFCLLQSKFPNMGEHVQLKLHP